jgi:general secretion pathway protein A
MNPQSTYESFFGLAARPFELTTNARLLCLTPTHREALSSLAYALSLRGGLTLMLGEPGTGKTTVLRAAVDRLATTGAQVVYISNPSLTRQEFFEMLAYRFGLAATAIASKAAFLMELEQCLRERRRTGVATALVVDEAQSLSDELLEEIRLLANLEDDGEWLMAVVLAGQTPLGARLNRPGLQQLKQRIAVRALLAPLSAGDTAAYVSTRVRLCGGEAATMFTPAAIAAVHDLSSGIPRVISAICGNALLIAFASGARPVDRQHIAEACRVLDIGGRQWGQLRDAAPPVSISGRADRDYLTDISRRIRLGDSRS